MRLICLGMLAVLSTGLFGCSVFVADPPAVVSAVDVTRYMGLWYEVARYPQSFQAGCADTTAEYTLRDDGRVTVLNRCLEEGTTGEWREIKGTARVVDPSTNAKLKVSFFGPFEGDYWIIRLGENYEYAVVSDPTRQTLWILSRTAKLDTAVFDSLLADLSADGFDPGRLVISPSQAAE